MNQCININQQLSRMSKNIADELQSKTACNVVSSCFANNIMVYYVFMDLKGLPSNTDYRIVSVNNVEHINNLNVYVNYLLDCLNANIYVQANICSISKIIYNITDGYEGVDINFEILDDTFNRGDKQMFFINEKISMKPSLEKNTVLILDNDLGNVLINFNTNIYTIKEVA